MVISLPGTIESKNCTDCLWSDPDTWESDVVPGENNHVVVNGKVILDVNATTLDLKINSSKSLETINNKSLTIKGFFENEGFLNVSGLELQKSQSLDGSKVSLQSLSAYGNITLTSHLEVLRPEVSNTDNVYLYGSGTITLGNYDLTCHGVYINLPAQQRSRVITNGTGALKFKVPAGSVNKEFVIGRI
ncbi:MAG: hypothetical protein ABS46_05600 [Cytophagaceae bacterium SCN 52-12]|nr:MAG: hypothetical protein ABS46_05600 [Cytophagaceae bacterium SCN 52-12]